ncbi:MAG: hypothetical protein WA767_14810, partial [Pseudolabrys sp.]
MTYFAVMRRADGAWRDRDNCESGPRIPAMTPKFHRNSYYDFFFFRCFDGVESGVVSLIALLMALMSVGPC